MGTLKVHLKRGVQLKAADRSGTADPCVTLTLGSSRKRSRVVAGTLDPAFDETIEFGPLHLVELYRRELELQLTDGDGATEGEAAETAETVVLGTLRLMLDSLRFTDTIDIHRRLSSQPGKLPKVPGVADVTAGSLHLSVEWVWAPSGGVLGMLLPPPPFSPLTAEEKAALLL